jgi:homoserine dehydrogenase
VLLTHKTLEGHMNRAIEAIEALDCVDGSVMRIRMETLD